MANLKTTLLMLHNDNFDESLKHLVEQWDADNITALQLFEVLDKGRTYETASDDILHIIKAVLDLKLKIEDLTLSEITEQVTWWKVSLQDNT